MPKGGVVKRWGWLFVLALTIVTVGCANRGRGVSYGEPISVICVENNPRVTVPGFEHDLENQLLARGIRAEIIAQYSECPQSLMLRYSAWRSMGNVTRVTLDLYENKEKVAFIDWNGGRGAQPPKIPTEVYYTVEYWQLAEALAGLFGDFEIQK
jgi:hypothetical protein